MYCPACRSSESKVTDSRPSDDGNSIRRRRECLDCGERYTTWENATNLQNMRRDVFEAAVTLSAALEVVRGALSELRGIERRQADLQRDHVSQARSRLTNAHPVIHDFKMNAGGHNVSAND